MKFIASSRNKGIVDPFWSFFEQPQFNSFPKKWENVRNIKAPMNIIEAEDVYNIEVSVPGWSKEEIEIILDKDTLKISGNRESENQEKKDEKVHLQEFKLESFQRSVFVGEHVEKDEIQAEVKDGVLTVVLPKVNKEAKADSKKIQIA